jgi:signal transduction histidine kinase
LEWATSSPQTRLIYSLRFRLIALTVVVAAITALIAALFATATITTRFENYLHQEELRHETRTQLFQSVVAEFLALYYQPGERWPTNIEHIVSDISEIIGYRVVLTDSNSNTIADTINRQPRRQGDFVKNSHIVDDNDIVGMVTVHVPPPRPDAESQNAFINSVSSALAVALVVSGAASIVLIIASSNPMLNMIEELTRAAHSMAQNHLDQRVKVRSRGEIGQLADSFNQMADSLARNEQVRRNMVNDIAHELRTPLSNMRGYMEALRDGVIEPDPALFDALHEQALMLNRLVDDLQELSLAEAGQLRLVQCTVHLPDIVQATLAAFQAEATRGGVTLRSDLPPDLPSIEADADRVRQMIGNLVKNAIHYTPEGGEVLVRAQATDTQVTVQVTDTGQGIEPEHLAHIFDRFYRVDPSRTRATGGYGLGLAIVKQLAESHGGHAWAHSEPGNGSTFGFTLPTATNQMA